MLGVVRAGGVSAIGLDAGVRRSGTAAARRRSRRCSAAFFWRCQCMPVVLAVVDLHAVHAHVALAGAGIAGDHAGERDEAAAVEGPAL